LPVIAPSDLVAEHGSIREHSTCGLGKLIDTLADDNRDRRRDGPQQMLAIALAGAGTLDHEQRISARAIGELRQLGG
jgi:hypothetical protein